MYKIIPHLLSHELYLLHTISFECLNSECVNVSVTKCPQILHNTEKKCPWHVNHFILTVPNAMHCNFIDAKITAVQTGLPLWWPCAVMCLNWAAVTPNIFAPGS